MSSLKYTDEFYNKYNDTVISVMLQFGPKDVVFQSLLENFCSLIFLLIKSHLEFELYEPYYKHFYDKYYADEITPNSSLYENLPVLNKNGHLDYPNSAIPSLQETITKTDWYIFNLTYIYQQVFDFSYLKSDYIEIRNSVKDRFYLNIPKYEYLKNQWETEIIKKERDSKSLKFKFLNKIREILK